MQTKHIFFNILIVIGGMLLIIYFFNLDYDIENTETLITDSITIPQKNISIDSNILTKDI